jgi:putative ABC transport system substrate-binding protein
MATIVRRELLAALAGTAALPIAARAQQAAMPVIGFLHPGSPETNAKYVAGFRKGLGEAGYLEGRNLAIEYHWGDDNGVVRWRWLNGTDFSTNAC